MVYRSTEYVTVENPIGRGDNVGKKGMVDVSRITISYGSKGVHAYPVKDW